MRHGTVLFDRSFSCPNLPAFLPRYALSVRRCPSALPRKRKRKRKTRRGPLRWRSEEHTSELQSLMRISYAVFCLKKKIKTQRRKQHITQHNKQHNIEESITTTEQP